MTLNIVNIILKKDTVFVSSLDYLIIPLNRWSMLQCYSFVQIFFYNCTKAMLDPFYPEITVIVSGSYSVDVYAHYCHPIPILCFLRLF